MRSFRRFTSGESQAAAARFPDFLLAMASPLKKSLRAAERKRADVARARRRSIREQGFLDPAHLVFIDETAVTTNMLCDIFNQTNLLLDEAIDFCAVAK